MTRIIQGMLFAGVAAMAFAPAVQAQTRSRDARRGKLPVIESAQGSAVKINEVDYDNVGSDAAEFVEISGPAGTDLSSWSLTLYNGAGGAAYQTFTFALGTTISASGYYVVCGDAANVPNCDLDVSPDTNLIQNGAPEAVVLCNDVGAVVDSMSYEGDMSAVGGCADGLAINDDLDTGSDSNAVDGSMQRCADGDGPFVFDGTITPGAANNCPTEPVGSCCFTATNLFANPSFDGATPLTDWGFFGNAFEETGIVFSAPGSAKMFGNFSGGFNVSGIVQGFPGAAGEEWRLEGKSFISSADPIPGSGPAADNWVVAKIAFFDAPAGTEIGGAEVIVADGTFATDVWHNNVVTGIAPAGTGWVEGLFLYLQPAFDGGAVFIDDAWLSLTSTCTDGVLQSACSDTFTDGGTCATVACGVVAACCTDTGCADLSEIDCASASGTYLGNGTACIDDPCPGPVGACCDTNTFTCSDNVEEGDCMGAGQTFTLATLCADLDPACPLGPPADAECLIISEVLDGTETGGLPKFVEITNTGATDYTFTQGGIIIQSNANTDLVIDQDLTGVTILAGDSYVIADSAFDGVSGGPAFENVYGFPADLVGSAFSNGDDRYILTNTADSSNLVDIHGEIDVDGTGAAWEYTDSYAFRNSNVNMGNGGVFDITEWTHGGVDALDGAGPAGIDAVTDPGEHAYDSTCGESCGNGVVEGMEACDNTALLADGGFESGFGAWFPFGNAFVESVGFALEGANTLKMFGNFSGGFNVTGVVQAFTAAAGETFRMEGSAYVWSVDPMVGAGAPDANWVVMKIAFFDAPAGGNEIGSAEVTMADGTSPQDTWLGYTIQGTAPAGTMRAEALFLYLQPAFDGGAIFIDDAYFARTNGCCNRDCTLAGAGTICRDAAGACDLAEACDGLVDTCGPDLFDAASECRPAAGNCDIAEFCDGSGADCPADDLAPQGTDCRDADGACDVAEVCDGLNPTCPADGFLDGTTECRAAAGDCDVAEFCSGTGPDCPANGFDSGTECRPSTGVCDPAESCDGMGADCPADLLSTAVCRVSAGPCDVAESCDGVNGDCPADGVAGTMTVCRASTGACDPAESCDGAGTACPADTTITDCVSGDGCCLAGCNNNNDSDCPAVCGNNAQEAGEECDDGNTADGDGCAADCTSEFVPNVPASSPIGMLLLVAVLAIGLALRSRRSPVA